MGARRQLRNRREPSRTRTAHKTARTLLAALLAATLLMVASPGVASAGDRHIRIVLDTSQSMTRTKNNPQGNDPKRLAVLSSLLLYDLAEPNLTNGDTFRVIPFKPDWPAPDPNGPVPTGTGPILEPDRVRSSGDEPRARAALADPLGKLKYDAQQTYFTPGIEAAIDELERLNECLSRPCVIVLLTDGVPEKPTLQRETDALRRLLPRIPAMGAKLYVLAFGAEVMLPENQAFFSDILGTNPASRVGELLVDPTGDALPTHMVDIFSKSFGYTAEGPKDISTPQTFLLADSDDNPQSAVVVFHFDRTPPQWSLDPQPRKAPSPIQTFGQPLCSYSAQWILRPEPKVAYEIRSVAGSRPQAVVLRPALVDVELRPQPPHKRLIAIGGEPFPVEVLVKPARGASGIPIGVEIKYNEAGEKVLDGGRFRDFSWRERDTAPQKGGVPRPPDGLAFPVSVLFHAPEAGQDSYVGHLEISAFRGQARVGDKRGDKAPAIDVYHPVHIKASPDHAQADGPALEKNQRGCAKFRLVHDTKTRLPHPGSPDYKVRARIGPIAFTGPLEKASFTLDGEPLEPDGAPGPSPGAWFVGASRPRSRLFDTFDHEICIHVGKPTAGATGLDIPIAFAFMEAPYDDLPQSIDPFTFKVTIAAPTVVERWAPWALLFGIPLLLLLALYYLRYRPDLPEDLRAAVGPRGGQLVPQRLGEPALWRKLLGLLLERPVFSSDGHSTLGWVRPQEGELYLFRPAEGVVRAVPGEPPLPQSPGGSSALIRVHQIYQVETGGRAYDVRLEYGR